MSRTIAVKSHNGIGDLLFITPTFKRLRETYPKIELQINTNHYVLLEENPNVDRINRGSAGIVVAYPDPKRGKKPTQHHIMSDWEIICKRNKIETEPPELKPEIYFPITGGRTDTVFVQTIHKGHWYQKKVWPYFDILSDLPGFLPIPQCRTVFELVQLIGTAKAVVCAEGGISHIAKALNIPAVVIYGGFALPEWNGYDDHMNLCSSPECAPCYNAGPCVHEMNRKCMHDIYLDQVVEAVKWIT